MSFLLSLLIFFFPGYAIARALRVPLSYIEEFVLSFVLGIGVFNFALLFLGKQGVLFTKTSLFALVFVSTLAPIALRFGYDLLKRWYLKRKNERMESARYMRREESVFASTGKERALFMLLLALTLLIKIIYLTDTATPAATDLGHHMYWSKLIAETGTLPKYAKINVEDHAGTYALSAPQPIADFIIGEHLPFAGIAIVSDADFFSAFPVDFLLLVDLLSLLAIFAFAVRIGEELSRTVKFPFSPFSFGLIALFLAGPLFALASPEAKYVSGGVVGNIFGNLFIPVIFLLFFRALVEKNSRFVALGIFLSFALAYIHHLSALVLAFALIGSFAAIMFSQRKQFAVFSRRIRKLLLAPLPIIVLISTLVFFFAVAMPTYLEINAAGTALGTPEKTTRTGLTLLQASQSSGQARMALGMAALLVLLVAKPFRRTFAAPLLFGFGAILIIMTVRPGLLFLNIPSDRIANYLSFPIILLAGSAIALIPGLLGRTERKLSSPLPGKLFLFFLLIIFTFTVWNGSSDNQKTIPAKPKAEETVQTFAASGYLAARLDRSDIFLKDHNYIVADSWMKLFFMRDYAYPLSRGYFKRYEDTTKTREQCTLLMISSPNLPAGEKCLSDLGVDVIAVNPAFDAAQFEKSDTFSRIYASDAIQVYSRFEK
jgi:hypothetical protein